MPLRGWQGKSITVMDINELSSKIIGSAIEVHKTLSALSAENEKYFFFSLRSLRLKRACERAVIFIFLLLLPISTTTQANDTSLPFQSIAIEAQFYDVLIQHPEFIKEGGAKIFAVNDGSKVLIGIGKAFPEDSESETVQQARRKAEIRARAAILAFIKDTEGADAYMATDLEKLELPLNYVPKLELGKEEMTSLSRSLVGDGKMWKINKLTFLLALFCYGCSYSVTPLVKVNRTADQREQTEKIPLSVAVVIPENVVSHTYRAPVGSPRRDVNIATGKAIKSLFKKGIPLIFQDASFIEEIDQAGKFDLYITPYIVTETTSLSKLNNITTEAKSGAIIESSDISFTVEGSGDDYHEISVATQLVDLANNLLLIGTLSASTIITGNDFLNFSFAQSFAVAYEKAFEDLMQKIRQSPEIKKIIVARSLPAELQTKIVFNDKKSLLPNKTIDAGESSAITATLTNKGKGTAFGVMLALECNSRGVSFPKTIDVGDIQPGRSKNLTIPIKAGLSLETGTANFLIRAHERRGYDARPVELRIATAALKNPKLFFASCNLNDSSGLGSGNGNNVPENDEIIEVDPYVRNQGTGEALKVKVKLTGLTRGIEVVKGNDELLSIAPGALGRAALAFKIPRTFSGNEIRYTVLARDVRGMKVQKTYTVPFEPKTPILYYTYRVVDSRNRDVPVLRNGGSYFLKVMPKNTGANIAEGVKVKITGGSDKIRIGNYDGEVGKLAPGGAGTAIAIPISLDRSFVTSSLSLDVVMKQEGFPGFTKKISLAVMVRRPNLSYDVALLNSISNQTVSQNSWPRFRVSVDNNGNLDARDVKVKFSVSGGKISFNREELIGTIKAGESQYRDFTFFVRGDAPIGKMDVDVGITQADFDHLEKAFAYRIAEQRAIVKEVKAIGSSSGRLASAEGYSAPPEVYVNSPNRNTKTYKAEVDLHGSIMTFGRGNAIDRLSVTLNNKPLTVIPVTEEIRLEKNNITRREVESNKVILDGVLALQAGTNELKITCVDRNNERVERLIRITRETKLGNIYAVVVGISNFANSDYDLRYAASDARKFSEFLQSDYGGGLSGHRLKLLTDTSATRAAVIGALTNFLGRSTREDTVEIYLATHGVTDLDGTLYYLCYDTDMTNLAGTGFSDNDLTRILNKNIKAGRIVIYLDACHSGLSGLSERYAKRSIGVYEVNDRINSLAAALSKAATTGVVCFSASSSTGYSLESPKWQGGIFTYTLINGLEGAANKNGDEWVSINELDSYLVTKIISVTGGKQRPRMNGTLVGDTPLSKVK